MTFRLRFFAAFGHGPRGVVGRGLVPLLAVLGACTRPVGVVDSVEPDEPQLSGPSPEAVFGSARNLILLHVDTLSASHTPWYGYSRDTMPRLHQRPWSVVDGYHATASWTATATASVLTAQPVEEHRVLWSGFDGENRGGGLVNEVMVGRTLAEILSEQGYATGLWSGNAFVTGEGRLDRGFDASVYSEKAGGTSNAGALVEQAVAFVDALPAEQPFFLMLQPMDAHLPYSPDPRDLGTWTDTDHLLFDLTAIDESMETEYREMVEDPALAAAAYQQWNDLYDEQLLGLDRALAGLLDAMEARGLLDDTLVVLVADHGEALGEGDPRVVGHGKSYRPAVLRAPLLVLSPGGSPERLSCTSSGQDLAPTLLRALGQPGFEDVAGSAMQDGCHSAVVSSFYLPDQLRFLSAQDQDGMLLLDCAESRIQAMDLAADPRGWTYVDSAELEHLRPTLEEAFAQQAAVQDLSACEAVLDAN